MPDFDLNLPTSNLNNKTSIISKNPYNISNNTVYKKVSIDFCLKIIYN